MITHLKRFLLALSFVGFSFLAVNSYAQQFNSDNWWVLPHGTATGIATIGEHYSTLGPRLAHFNP